MPSIRKGKPFCFHNEIVSWEELEQSGNFADNEIKIFGEKEYVVLYEASSKDESIGYYSEWLKHSNLGGYTRIFQNKDADDKIYNKFENMERSDISHLNE